MTIKFCKDCKWNRRTSDWWMFDWIREFDKCIRPDVIANEEKARRHYLVTGNRNYFDYPSCRLEREERYKEIGACGEGAEYFEPKKGGIKLKVIT